MKCPLLVIANCALPSMPDTVEIECQGEECAWWDTDVKRCSIATLKVALTGVALNLIAIEKQLSIGGDS